MDQMALQFVQCGQSGLDLISLARFVQTGGFDEIAHLKA
jgi:hypothetical protein